MITALGLTELSHLNEAIISAAIDLTKKSVLNMRKSAQLQVPALDRGVELAQRILSI